MSDFTDEGEAAYAEHLAEEHSLLAEYIDAKSDAVEAASRMSHAADELADKFGIFDVDEYLLAQ